jgi:hypothetical protein
VRHRCAVLRRAGAATGRNSGLACALVCVPEAFADLLLVDGNPLASINPVADPEKNFIIMKDGRIDKNTLPR